MSAQASFTFHNAPNAPTLNPVIDGPRIDQQRQVVFNLMRDGEWRSLWEIEKATGAPTQSASARLRDFRKAKYGSHTVLRKRVERGLWVYRLLLNEEA